MESEIRPAAVAGLFYPADAATLQHQLDEYLSQAETKELPPKAMIVPHAGTIYSGSIAASAYARLKNAEKTISRVVLLGPAHRVSFRGVAAPTVKYFSSPLGKIPIDTQAIQRLKEKFPQIVLDDNPHAEEHSLEVHLPFLQKILQNITLLPLLVGQADPEEVAEILHEVWGGPETLIVISSDLSHFHDYATAKSRDARTSKAIEDNYGEHIGSEDACGFLPVRGLLLVAKDKGLKARTIDLRNSGDTAGTKDRVVGYGAYVFE